MSGGDFLFIFSFIVLPTAILVSAIWALIAIRAGVLLPPRPAMELDEEYDASDEPVDEPTPVTPQRPATDRPAATAAVTAPTSPPVEPSIPLAVTSERDAGVSASEIGSATDSTTIPPAVPVGVRHDIADPPAEQTLEMDAVEVSQAGTTPTDPAPVQAAPPIMNVNLSETGTTADVTSTPAPTVPSPPVRPPSPSVPDDLDVVFVPGNRAVPTATKVTDRERPDGTGPLPVEQQGHEVPDNALLADDLTAITPDEAPSDVTPPTPATPAPGVDRDAGQRRGGRSLTRRRQSDDSEPRQRILVAQPTRRNARAHRPDEAASVTQDEGLVQRGDGA